MKLSVIIPVYNQEDSIKSAIFSVPIGCEIIVVNDGSTDNTIKSVLELQKIVPNMEVLHYPDNRGVSHAINKGLNIATGDYVVLLGSDDYFYPDALRLVMEQTDGTDLIYFDLLTNNGTVFAVNQDSKMSYCGSVKLMRREFIGSTRNREDLRVKEDLEFYKELLAKNPTEKFTNIIAKHYNYPRVGSLSDLNSGGI